MVNIPEDRPKGQTVAEAAELLGISAEAVRKRIARGSLTAQKEQDNTWTVYLDQQDEPQDAGRGTEQDIRQDAQDIKKGIPAKEPFDQQDTGQDTQDAEQDSVLLAERVGHLQSTLEIKEQEIKRLERIIDQQAEESRRKDTILLNLTNRIPQLEAPKEEKKREGLSWFNRLFKR